MVNVQVVVTKLRIHLLKVVFATGGYHLVCGGRLVLEAADDGKKTPHPDLPPYTTEMFPGFQEWSSGSNVAKVMLDTPHGERELRVVRACTLLFTTLPRDRVLAFIRSGGEARQ